MNVVIVHFLHFQIIIPKCIRKFTVKLKPYICTEWENTGARLNLYTYQKTLFSEKLFVLNRSVSSWMSVLNIYQRTYTREKPYECTDCGSHFRK